MPLIQLDHKTYLGDGAFVGADPDDGDVVLTTEDGIDVNNTVYLGDAELLAFIAWLHARGVLRPLLLHCGLTLAIRSEPTP